MEKGSIAKDTLADCLATVLLVGLLIGGVALTRPETGTPLQTVEQAAAARDPLPPYVF